MLDADGESGAHGRRILTWLDNLCRRSSNSPESLWRRRVMLGYSLAQVAMIAGLASIVESLPGGIALIGVLVWHMAVLRSLWRGVSDERCAALAIAGMLLFCLVAWFCMDSPPLGALLALLLCAFCLLGRRGVYVWLALLSTVGALVAFGGPFDTLLRLSPFDGLALLSALFTVALYVHCGSLLAQDFQVAEQARVISLLDDEITGLFNGRGLGVRLSEAVEHARRNGTLVGAAVFRLESWGRWEDSALASPILREVADRIRSCLRQTDLAAYTGRGEFIFILCNLKGRRGMETVLQRAQMALAEPFPLVSGPWHLHGGLGAAIFPFDAELPEDLLELARADGEKFHVKDSAPLLPIAG